MSKNYKLDSQNQQPLLKFVYLLIIIGTVTKSWSVTAPGSQGVFGA
jgi:hypothetical protein